MVVLAAGQGKRMMSTLPKVAHPAMGRPLVGWVLQSVAPLEPDTTTVVIGHGAEIVSSVLPEGTVTVLQEEQRGTGHAVSVALPSIAGLADDDVVVVLYGDVPMLGTELIGELAALDPGETGRLITTVLDDPTGYGRVVRDPEGRVVSIVEEADCTPKQAAIEEVNAGIYALRAGALIAALAQIDDDNAQGELYLTDVIGIIAEKGDRLTAVAAPHEEVMGINSHDQLADAQRALQRRVNSALMESGVWMLDPDRTYIDDTVEVEPGARIYPGVHLEGTTKVAAGAIVGPDVFAIDSEIGPGSRVWYSVLRHASVGEDCQVGPFASLRPGTVLEHGAKVGTFVETKNTTLGEGAKAPHLAYLGDATVGAHANIGAGAITCNYDGFEKHHTEIGEGAFIGSDTMLVAPVKIGDGAFTGAGSVITSDVPSGSLGVERTEQREIPGYAERRKARRAAADAED